MSQQQQKDLELLEQKLLLPGEEINNEEHMLRWIHMVFSKGSPPAFIGQKSLLSVYLNSYLQNTLEPNPLCVSAFELMAKPFVKDNGDTLISNSIIFKITTLAYDIEDYLESKNCPVEEKPKTNKKTQTSLQEDLEALEQKLLLPGTDTHSEEYMLKWIRQVFLKGDQQSFLSKKSLLSVHLNAYIQHTSEPNSLCVSAFELMTKPFVEDTGDTHDSITFKITTLAYEIEDYLESKNLL